MDELGIRYVLADLSPAEAQEFERALAADPALAAQVARLAATLDQLPYAKLIEPPARLRARLLAAAQTARVSGALDRLRGLAWSRGLAAAAALAAVLIAVDDRRVRRELALLRDTAQLLQQPNVVLPFPVEATVSGSNAFGSILLDLDAKKAAVVLRGLPPLAEDEVYRLWAQLADRKLVPCGDLSPDDHGAVMLQIPIPVDAYTSPVRRLIVTREAAAPAAQPQGPRVMESS